MKLNFLLARLICLLMPSLVSPRPKLGPNALWELDCLAWEEVDIVVVLRVGLPGASSRALPLVTG